MAIQWLEDFRMSTTIRMSDLLGCHYLKSELLSCIIDDDLNERFLLPENYTILLYGEAGNGKSLLAEAFAGELQEERYKLLRLSAYDFIAENEKTTCQQLENFFLTIEDIQLAQGVYVWLEDLDVLCDNMNYLRSFQKNLQRTFRRIKLPFILLATTHRIEQIPEIIQKNFLCYYVGLPNLIERKEYLEAYLDNEFYRFETGLTYFELANLSDGLNFNQLKQFTRMLSMDYKHQILEGVKNGKREDEYCLTKTMVLTAIEQLKTPAKKVKQILQEKQTLPVFLLNSNLAAVGSTNSTTPDATPTVSDLSTPSHSAPSASETPTFEKLSRRRAEDDED